MVNTSAGQPEPGYTMPCEGLQVLELLGEESKRYRMKMLVGRYQHASRKCQYLM
jgi:hypothetical protein